MQQVLGCSVSYRIAVGPQQGRKVFTLQTIPSWEDDDRFSQVAKASGFSLHAGAAAQAWERQKLERLARYITRPAVSEKRLSLTPSGNIRYQLKTPFILGHPTPATVKAFTKAGYSEKGILAITLAVSVKILSNYSNHYFDTPVDEVFSAFKVE